MGPIPCAGVYECSAICTLNATCNQMGVGGGGGSGADYDQCLDACEFLPPLEGD
jgi:hypothetical protein